MTTFIPKWAYNVYVYMMFDDAIFRDIWPEYHYDM